MAVEESFAGVVGEELDFDGGVGWDKNDILVDAGDFSGAFDAAKFEGVAMEMDGVVVHALVVHDEAIALAGAEARELVWCGVLRVAEAIDEPLLFVSVAMKFSLEDEVDTLIIWAWCGGGGGELVVIPKKRFRLVPHGFAGGIGIFKDDAHPGGLHMPADFAENPCAGIVHFDDGRDAFGRREAQHGYGLRSRDSVAVEGDDFEGVARQGDPMNLGGAAVEDVQEYALAGLYLYRIAEAEHLAVDGGNIVDGVHVAVVVGHEVTVPIVEGEEDFAVVVARVGAWFDEKEAVQATELRAGEVFSGEGVGVIPAKARG